MRRTDSSSVGDTTRGVTGNARVVARRRALQRRRPGAPVPQTKEGRRGKTRRRQLLLNAMALRPGLVFAEGVGSAFCPLTLSRRLHCLRNRCSQPATRTVAL